MTDWTQLGVLIAALVGLSVLHGKWVVPAIIRECRKEWQQDIILHMAPISGKLQENHERLERIEKKLDEFQADCREITSRRHPA